jgi:DNA topoisomerase-1
LNDDNKNVREINANTSIRKGPKGDYIFYKTPKMKKPKFFDLKNFTADVKEDYKICDITILKFWIKDKYDI